MYGFYNDYETSYTTYINHARWHRFVRSYTIGTMNSSISWTFSIYRRIHIYPPVVSTRLPLAVLLLIQAIRLILFLYIFVSVYYLFYTCFNSRWSTPSVHLQLNNLNNDKHIPFTARKK